MSFTLILMNLLYDHRDQTGRTDHRQIRFPTDCWALPQQLKKRVIDLRIKPWTVQSTFELYERRKIK